MNTDHKPEARLAEGKPSQTAMSAAMYRAAHQLVDRPPVFEDPLALKIIGIEARNALRSGTERWTSQRSASFRAIIAVRSRYTEDCFEEAYGTGTRQYVVLGAGLDTFAYRMKLGDVKIFEVDHPATQEWKRRILEETGIAVPPNLTFAPVDFENETLRDGFNRTDFDFSKPAFFAWLGVTPYLTHDAIMNTLSFIAHEMKTGSEIVFDYATPPSDDPHLKARQEALIARVGSIGEPIKSIFYPAELEKELKSIGFSKAVTEDFNTLNSRYFEGRADGLRLHHCHIMHART